MRKSLTGESTLLPAMLAIGILWAAATPLRAQLTTGIRPADDLDRLVEAQMKLRQVPGLSLAVVEDGKIVDVRTYGTTKRGGGTPVTPTTLFQAASISKPVAALGALHLVERGKLSLDEPVNHPLESWKVPENDLTRSEPVTLRRLLSHTAGINLGGIPGYPATDRIPSLAASLNGEGNTPPLAVTLLPGSRFRYSGGGYAVTQQLVEDVTVLTARAAAATIRDRTVARSPHRCEGPRRSAPMTA